MYLASGSKVIRHYWETSAQISPFHLGLVPLLGRHGLCQFSLVENTFLTCMLEIILAAGTGRSVTIAVPCLHLSVMGGTGDTSLITPLLPALGFWELCHSVPWSTTSAFASPSLLTEVLQMAGSRRGGGSPLGHPENRGGKGEERVALGPAPGHPSAGRRMAE